jgi:hypothetical protein
MFSGSSRSEAHIMIKNSFKTIILTSLLGTAAQAEIASTNLSGKTLQLSLHGDGCRHFEGDRFSYPACAEQTIEANETVCFSSIFPGQELSVQEKFVSPKVIFRLFGFFTYGCQVTEFVELRVCSFVSYLFENEEPTHQITRSSADVIGTGGLQLSVDVNYHLSILPGWRLYPTPQVDCKLARVHESFVNCIK